MNFHVSLVNWLVKKRDSDDGRDEAEVSWIKSRRTGGGYFISCVRYVKSA